MLCLALAALIVPLIATTDAPQVTFADPPSIDQIFATYIDIHPGINIVRIAREIRESNPSFMAGIPDWFSNSCNEMWSGAAPRSLPFEAAGYLHFHSHLQIIHPLTLQPIILNDYLKSLIDDPTLIDTALESNPLREVNELINYTYSYLDEAAREAEDDVVQQIMEQYVWYDGEVLVPWTNMIHAQANADEFVQFIRSRGIDLDYFRSKQAGLGILTLFDPHLVGQNDLAKGENLRIEFFPAILWMCNLGFFNLLIESLGSAPAA